MVLYQTELQADTAREEGLEPTTSIHALEYNSLAGKKKGAP